MFCPNCGTQLPDGSAFCSSCGAQLGGAQAPQQPVQQPAYQQQPQMAQQQWQAQQQYVQQQQQPKKNTKKLVKIAVICVAIVLVYNVAKALLSDWLDDGDPVDYRPNQITDVTVTPSGGSSGSTSGGGSASGGSLLDVGGSSGGSSSSSKPTGAQTAASYSTNELPNEADFSWFYDEYIQGIGSDPNTGLPRGAETFIDPTLLTGGWKVTIYRRNIDGDVWRKEFHHFDVTSSGNEIEADVVWSGYVENDSGGWVDARAASPDHYSGEWELVNGTLHVSMADYYDLQIDLLDFYTKDGKQYAMGTYYNPRDEVKTLGFAAFCRP